MTTLDFKLRAPFGPICSEVATHFHPDHREPKGLHIVEAEESSSRAILNKTESPFSGFCLIPVFFRI